MNLKYLNQTWTSRTSQSTPNRSPRNLTDHREVVGVGVVNVAITRVMRRGGRTCHQVVSVSTSYVFQRRYTRR